MRGVLTILLIGNVVGMCGHNVDDVRFWLTFACMERNSVRDGVSRYDVLILVAKRYLGGPK